MMMGATLMLTRWWQMIALIYRNQATMRNLALFCLRYLGAVSSKSSLLARVSLRSVYPYTEARPLPFYALFVIHDCCREMTFATLWHVLDWRGENRIIGYVSSGSLAGRLRLITVAELPMMVSDLPATVGRFTRLLFVVMVAV